MALDLHKENNAICRSMLKTISKLRDQISLRWQQTRVHSEFVGHSTEIMRQSKIKGILPINVIKCNKLIRIEKRGAERQIDIKVEIVM